MIVLELAIFIALGYLALGLPVAAAFAIAAVHKIDPAARGAGPAFRVLIVPGAAALWPLMLARWLAAGRREPCTDAAAQPSTDPDTGPNTGPSTGAAP